MVKLPYAPLPLDFYKAKMHYEALLTHFVEQQQSLPQKSLEKPLKQLVGAVKHVVDVYGDYTEPVRNFFRQTINPLFEAEEYRQKVYDVLIKAAEDNSYPKYASMADSLLFIRNMFVQDRLYIDHYFKDEVGLCPGADYDAKRDIFGRVIQHITQAHMKRMVQVIEQFMEENKRV